MQDHHVFHFDFTHLNDVESHEMYAKIRGQKIPLTLHNEESFRKVVNENSAARALMKSNQKVLSHFVSIPKKHIHKHYVNKLTIVGPSDESHPTEYLPFLYYVGYLFHKDDHIKYFRKQFKKHGPFLPASFVARGVSHESLGVTKDLTGGNDPWQWLEDTYHLNGPEDVAIYLSGHHPRVLSNKSAVSLAMVNEHVFPVHKTDPQSINQVNNVRSLTQSIKQQGQPPNGFAVVKHAEDHQGKPMNWEYDFKDENGKVIRKSGDAVLIYDLTDTTVSFLAGTASNPVQTSRNDPQFQNHTWAVNQGQTSFDQANQAPSGPQPMAKNVMAAVSGHYQLSPNTSSHGVWADQNTISVSSGSTPGTEDFSIDVHNYFLRSVGAYIEFFSDTEFNKPISNPTGWQDQLPKFLSDLVETDSKKFIEMVPNVNSILGIPMPTDPTTLEVPWPDDAQSAKLLFGGIGTYNWDDHIVWPGFMMTGFFQFGIPLFFMAAGAAVTNSNWYKEFIKDTNNVAAAVGVGFSGGTVAFGTYAAIKGLKKALWTFGGMIAGFLAKKLLVKLVEKIALKIAAAEVADEVPFVGWATRIASMALDAAQMAVTLGEVLSSPAVIEVEVKRQMTLAFTLHPDPDHGESGNPQTAIWPAVGDHYRILVNYKNGTSFEAKGKVPLSSTGGPSNQPIKVTFTVPWGGKLQVMAGIYSKTEWLCGKYQSKWLDAVPTDLQAAEMVEEGNITEILVPLTQDTQYQFKWKIAYDDTNKHHWWGPTDGAKIPEATVSSLDSSPTGNNISALGGITINESAFVVGYTWKGSNEGVSAGGPGTGQTWVFQNISVLSDPQSKLKFPEMGFNTKPGLAFDVYGGTKDEVGPLNFVIDTRAGSNGYLRKIDLMDGKPNYGLTSATESYGVFTLGNIDAVAVHPKGYVVAANWNNHRLQILKLPSQAVADQNAPAAVVVSNKGIQEGLVQGPKALAISPDGKILVLETYNERVQAFDTKGNPAPAFTGKHLFDDPNGGTYKAELNNKVAPAPLIAEFINNGAAHLFDLDPSLSATLDAGKMTMDVINAFAENMVYLAYEKDANGNIQPDPAETSFITVVTKGSQWNVTDPSRKYVYVLNKTAGTIEVNDQFQHTEVIIIKKDLSWQLKDLAGGRSFLLTLSGNKLSVDVYLSYFPINPNNDQLTYLDLAVESKGYIYVLAFKGSADSGPIKNTAYVLDVYTPDGKFLFRSPDSKLSGSNMEYVSAGKIALDIWRNMFSMNYEAILGPGNRTEPSVSQWTPTPPLFDLPNTDYKVMDSGDMTKIRALFTNHHVTLSNNATIATVVKTQHWTITDPDNSKVYDLVNSVGKIYVYSLPGQSILGNPTGGGGMGMGALTDHQKGQFEKVNQLLGIDPGNVIPSLTTADRPLTFSSDHASSSVKLTTKTFDSLESLKELIHALGKGDNHLPESNVSLPPKWQPHIALDQISGQQEKDLMNALFVSLTHHIDSVDSYKDVLPKRFFPLNSTAAAVSNVTVTKDNPLIINPGPHDPVIVNIGTLTLEEGGQIQCNCAVVLKVQNFIKE